MSPVYLICKVGNNDLIHSRMVVDYYDPLEWGHTEAQEAVHFSAWMKTVYAIVRVPRSFPYKEYVKPRGVIIPGDGLSRVDEYDKKRDDYRARSRLLDFDALAIKMGDADLRTKLSSRNPVEIIDAETFAIDESLFKDSTTEPREDLRDFNVITSGTHTIGTAKDYATCSAFFSDIANLTGNLTGEVQTDVTETAQSSPSADRGGFDITLNPDTDHGGDVTAARQITSTYVANFPIDLSFAGSGNTIIDNLRFNWGANPSSVKYLLRSDTANHTWKNLYIDGQSHSNGRGIYITTSTSTNSFVVNSGAWDLAWGFVSDQAGHTFDNCTAYNNTTYGFWEGGTTGTTRSNGSFDSGTDDFNNVASVTKNNLASSDATATGTAPQINLTTANEIYTTDTSANFLHPKEGATVATNGNTTHTESTDAAGVTWDGSDPSIGMFQFVAASSGFGGLLSSQRNRLVL